MVLEGDEGIDPRLQWSHLGEVSGVEPGQDGMGERADEPFGTGPPGGADPTGGTGS